MLFWAALAVGILVKGPVAPMVVGLTGIVLTARLRSLRGLLTLRPVAGALLLIVIVLPWLLAIAFISEGAFFRGAVGQDFLAKIGEGQEGHGAPPGTYLALLAVTGWPMTPFLILAIPDVLRRWREPSVFFCIAWLVPAWLVFEAVATKLPHYTLPLYPALALLTGASLARDALSQSRLLRLLAIVLLVFLPLGAAVGELVVPPLLGDRVAPLAFVTMAGAALVALLAGSATWRGRFDRAVLGAALAAVLLYAGAIALALPRLQSLWLSPRLVAAAEASAGCEAPQLASSGYSEPSLIFYGGTSVRLVAPAAAAAWLGEPGCRVAAIADSELSAFNAALGGDGRAAREVATLSGFNYSRGRPVTMHLFVAAPAP